MILIDKIKSGLKKRKVKIFLVFLLCSGLIWFIDNLSETYISNAAFDLEYVNMPEGYLFKGASKDEVEVKLRAGGFQFLGFNFRNKKVRIDMSEAEQRESKFYVPKNVYRGQIERQLSGSMALLEIDNDTLFLDMLAVITKKVPIKPRVEMNLARNYLLDGKIRITPDSMVITGPKEEIDSIDQVRTKKITLPDLTSDFSESVEIFKSQKLENTTYSEQRAELSGKIARFSEKVFEVPIQVINLPNGLELRTFPDKISVLCKAKMKRLKELEDSDFQVVADYETIKNGDSNTLTLQLRKKPKNLHSVRLKENEVEYIVKKQ